MHPWEAILGNCHGIGALRDQIRRLAAFDGIGKPHVPTVLLEGETGTGKGLVARVLHESGPRAKQPFIDVNCAAIPDTMLEAELFGFEAGAFTDARRSKPGLFEAASSGTLFLDEIDSLSLPLQAKLLKAIEEKSIRRLGAVAARRVDVKLVAATQHDLAGLVASGQLRADLYHRLAVLVLRIPPLRERGDDAVLLASRFLDDLARAHGLAPRRLREDARDWLRRCSWPGNVRELSHLIERVVLLGPEDDVDAATLAQLGTPFVAPSAPEPSPRDAAPAGESPEEPPGPAEETEAERIRAVLRRSGGNVVAAAKALGIGRNALRYRMRRLGVQRPSLEDLVGGPEEASRPAEPAPRSETPAAPRASGDDGGVPGAAAAWEEKRAAALAIDLFFPEPGDGEQPYEPWTATARWKQTIAERLRGFGGVLLDESGSRLTAVFGVPRALEQMPQRAVRAALALQHLATSASLPRPELRIAAHLGEVRFDAGASAPPRLLALGDTVALPERLLGHAGAGELLISDRMARQVARICALEPRSLSLGPRGEDRITVYAATTGRATADTIEGRSADPTGPFVGRAHELAILDDAFRSAAAGQGQVVFLAGEAGIGKSRLLLELQRRLRDTPHLWIEGRCASYGGSTPFLPVIDGLRRLFHIDTRDDDDIARTKVEVGIAAFGDDLGWALPLLYRVLSLPAAAEDEAVAALDSASRRSETYRALSTILARAARTRPLVVVVEDLHWIDETSEEFLGFVGEMIPTLRAVLLCTHRPGYVHPFGDRSYHQRLRVRPLGETEMAAMTSAVLGSAEAPPELHALVAHKAEGNPLFVEEVTRSLLEDGSLRRENGRVVLTREVAEISIPDTVQDVLTARLDRLADDARQAIQIASVIGREFAFRLLERISAAGEQVRTQLDELRAVELIYEKALHPELAYMFKHALTHDVAYRSVAQERRRALHRTIGDAIEELYADRLEEHYETLAHHFARAEEWQRALAYHERAVAKASERHETRAVVQHCREALAIADRLGDEVAPETREHLETALGLASFYLSDFRGSGEAFERAALASSDSESADLHRAHGAHSFFWGHEYERAREIADRLLAEPVRRTPGVAFALNARAFERAVLEADLAGAERDCAAALEIADGRFAAVEGMVRFNQTLFAEWTGHYSRAIALAERAMEIGRNLRLAHLVVWPHWFLGKSRCCLGDYGGAISHLEQGYEICDRIGDRAWKSRLLNTLGWCLAEIGGFDRAREYDSRAAELGHQLGDPEIIANSEINLALDHLGVGRLVEAGGFLEPLEQATLRSDDPWMRWRYSLHLLEARAHLELARRAPEAALGAAEREAAGAVERGAPKIEARALLTAARALLELERWDEARARLEAALAVAERIHVPRFAWRAHGLLARLERTRGRREAAEHHAASHARLLDRSAYTLPEGELRRRLRETAARETLA